MAFGVEEKPLQGESQLDGPTNGSTSGEANMLPKGGPLNSPSRVSIVCIGAGVSGIATAIRVQETMKDIDLDIYEKNHDLGGTWLENRYPGCACDVPAHAYIYTFEPNPDYSRYYVGGVEIHGYLKAVADKHGVGKYIKYYHRLVSAIWNESTGRWDLDFEVTYPNIPAEKQTLKRSAHVLLNAGGLLNNWKWPAIPGLHDFKGHLCHSASWQHDYDWHARRIAIIGSGSSAIQIVPELQPLVKEMKAFIRSPTWIAPSQGFVDPENAQGPKNFYYTDEEKKQFRANPDEFLRYRKKIEGDMNKTFETMLMESPKQKGARKVFAEIMKQRLNNDEVLAEKLTPKWAVGCRRLTPGQNFLESLVKENVEVVTDEIERVEADGLVTAAGKKYEVDAIVCATGFDTTYRPRFKLVGRKGVPLSEIWKDTEDVMAYLAVAVPDFPNYFMFLGPHSPISNGTLIPVMEKQCEYMLKFVQKMQRQRIKYMCPFHSQFLPANNLGSFAVKSEPTRTLNAHHQAFLRRHMVFADSCRSWYKGGKADGKVIGIWPGSSLHYYETISEPRYEDYEYTYADGGEEDGEEEDKEGGWPMWRYLGNGFTEREMREREEPGSQDLAWYLEKPVGEAVLVAPES